MHRSIPLVAVSLVFVLAACGAGGDGGDDDAAASTATTQAAETAPTVAGPATLPPPVDECEDEPDPADYPKGELPPVLRPCEIPDELVVQTIRPGTGREAADGDTVLVDYTGIRAETGEPFDSSYLRGMPFNVVLGRGEVIAGWDDGLQGVQTGELLKVTIPADLAYGDNPVGDVIQPGDALTFIMEVRAVIPATTADDAPLGLVVDPSVGATEVTWYDATEGDGDPIELGDTAVVHMLLVRGDNEVVLFNSWERNDPLQIIMREGQTLPGIFEGIQDAHVGTIRVISMPPDDAFGPQGETGLGLPPGTDLIAIIEVVGVY